MDNLVTHETPSWWELRARKYSIFDAFGEAYLCLLKRFLLFVSEVFVGYFIRFSHGICMRKMLEKPFLGAHTVQNVPKQVWMGHC